MFTFGIWADKLTSLFDKEHGPAGGTLLINWFCPANEFAVPDCA